MNEVIIESSSDPVLDDKNIIFLNYRSALSTIKENPRENIDSDKSSLWQSKSEIKKNF